MKTPLPRLSILFGPRRGVTRDVRERVLVGRGAHCELQLIDEKTSREHCVFENRDGVVEVVDLNSRNGTWVNGERVTRHVLQPNDSIGIGETLIVFSPDVEALLARDGDSTLITSQGALAEPLVADAPSDDAYARAGRLMLEASLSTSPDEAALKLARAVVEALGCDEAFVVSRNAEGVWRP